MTRHKRIGTLVPATNPVVEPDFNMMTPNNVVVLSERMWNQEELTEPGGGDGTYLRKMNADIPRAARSLARAEVDVITYACTSGTYHTGGIGYSREISRMIYQTTGVPAVTALEASVEALKHVGAHRISAAGPYGNFLLQQRLKPLLEEAGFEVVSAEGEPEMQQRTTAEVISNQDPEVILNFVPKAVMPESDTIYLPGTAWRAVEVVEELEQRIGKTVITVNQATIWMALRMTGEAEPVQGFGKLLTDLPEMVA